MPQRVVYSVRPKQPFYAANELFLPGRGEYIISEDVYNGQTSDGQNVKDLCDPATQQTQDY